MNKKWIESEKLRLTAEADAVRTSIVEQINRSELITEQDKHDLIIELDKDNGYRMFEVYAMLKLHENHEGDEQFTHKYFDIKDFIKGLNTDSYNSLLYKINCGLERYLDSEPMEFDGDIIITDPCYIMRAEHHGTAPLTDNDWIACGCGDNMGVLGIHHHMTRDTLYGDWGCTVYNTDTKESIGEFCADAGLVSVFLLDEVLKYNPDFDYHKERKWTTTLIPDFKGTVQLVVEREEGVYEEDSDYWKAGDKWEDYSLHVVGNGINKKTGEPINFYSTQTEM